VLIPDSQDLATLFSVKAAANRCGFRVAINQYGAGSCGSVTSTLTAPGT
jgi:hypothetical protein